MHLFALTRPQQTVVDEHTRQPVADGALNQGRGHRGIHSPGQPADRMCVTDLGPHRLDQGLGDVGRGPGRPDTGEIVQEPAEHLLAVRAVHHLGVVLHAGESAGAVLERGHRRTGTVGDHLEALRGLGDRVAVTHPHRLSARKSRMQLAAKHIQLGTAVFTGPRAGHGTAEGLRHGLEAVADAEHRNPQVEQSGVELRSTVGVDAGRPTGEHDGLRVLGLDLGHPRGVRDDLGEHPCLTDPPRDQLGVLGTEVDHQDGPWGSRVVRRLHRDSLSPPGKRGLRQEMPADGASVAQWITMADGSAAADDPEVIWTIGRLRSAPGACAGTTGRTGGIASSLR